MGIREVLELLTRHQVHLEIARKKGAPKALLDIAESNVKHAEGMLWKIMEAGFDQRGEELPPILTILGRETLLARCRALAAEVLVPFEGLHGLVREGLEKALSQAGVQLPEEGLSVEEEDALFEQHAPDLFFIMVEVYAAEAAVMETLFLQKWEEVKQALQF